MKEFPDSALCSSQGLSAHGSGPVHSPERFAVSLFDRSKIALFLQPLEKGIETAWTDPVSVTRQFFDHSQSEDWTFNGMMQNVEAD
jgi:hypothetical protein